MCDCKKNQTHDDVFNFMKSKKLNPFVETSMGIGLFLIPAPEFGILEYKTVNVSDLTYRETVKRGENCTAFQWLPYGITLEGLNKRMEINSLEDFESIELNCNDSCRGGCPMNGCFCRSGETWCHR